MLRKAISVLLALSFLLASCASHMVIKSCPDGAEVYLDNIKKGVTPLEYSDFAVAGTEKSLRLEKEGYKPLETIIMKDKFKVLPCIGTVFCFFPIAWVFGYPEEQTFELEKLPDEKGSGVSTSTI
jgi:hypothetical protein